MTIQYPEEKTPVYPRFRGRHKLHRFEDTGLEKCVGCSLCAAACPADCIRVVAAENDPDDRVSAGERYAAVYEINLARCIFCGYCEVACPFDAITMGHEYEMADYNRNDLIFTKEILLAALDREGASAQRGRVAPAAGHLAAASLSAVSACGSFGSSVSVAAAFGSDAAASLVDCSGGRLRRGRDRRRRIGSGRGGIGALGARADDERDRETGRRDDADQGQAPAADVGRRVAEHVGGMAGGVADARRDVGGIGADVVDRVEGLVDRALAACVRTGCSLAALLGSVDGPPSCPIGTGS